MKFIAWYNSSLSRRISSIFMVLLTILLIVIVFSIYKLRVIDSEMKEVAYIDVPLNQIMGRIEMLQLEQHILLEQFKLKEHADKHKLSPSQEYAYQKKQIKDLLDKAVGLVMQNLEQNHIRFERGEHRQLLQEIEHYHERSNQFEQVLGDVLDDQETPLEQKIVLEDLANQLESSVQAILQGLDKLTDDTSRYTEKHEQEFYWINIALGVCATILGIALTTYIVRFFMLRIARIKQDIQHLDESITHGETAEYGDLISDDPRALDEFSQLEVELKHMMVRLAQEITNREQVEQELLMLATRDKLTGAYNRHKWDEQFKLQVELARQGSPLSLILLDIDYFKKINDQYGHSVGDKILKHLCGLLTSLLRSSDQLFRIGGEEFAILLPLQNGQAALQLAETLRVAVETSETAPLPGFTVSIGVTQCQTGDTVKSLFNRTDQALYQAKAQGRNQVVME